jgi:hypothetical protein
MKVEVSRRACLLSVLGLVLAAVLGTPNTLRCQTANGAIAGTVLDVSGAAIANATITATAVDTGTVSKTATTSTGAYVFPDLAPGAYDLTFTAAGFAAISAVGIEVEAVKTKTVNMKLQVGSIAQTVTVTEAAPLIETESAQITATVPQALIENVPFFNSNYGFANPTLFANTQPGTTAMLTSTTASGGNDALRVNGLPNNTYRVIVDGQDMTSSIDPTHLSETNPSVYALAESTLQVSSFDAEFGQVAGGLLNYTTKSGTNQYHGQLWENWVNEVLNAGNPWSNVNGPNLRPVDRANGFGFQAGGPVSIPKLYNGKDRTFFFFNWEFYQQGFNLAGNFATAPTAAYRTGNFSAAEVTASPLGTDPLGRPIYQNEIYDPTTTRVYNGQIVRDPFPNNTIPANRLDPVAAAIQKLIPAVPSAYSGNSTNNYPASQLGTITDFRSIPSVRVDQNVGATLKLGFYYQQWRDDLPNNYASYFPWPIADSRLYMTRVHTYRFNIDDTLTSRLFLHFGLGEQGYVHGDHAPASELNYNATANVGLVGGSLSPAPFPELTGLYAATGGGITPTGASTAGTIGFSNYGIYTNDTPTLVGFLTWLKGNHTFKFGGEGRENLWTDLEKAGTGGVFTFAPQETGLPYLDSGTLKGGDVGFPYASFLLGTFDSAYVRSEQEPTFMKISYALYAQDTWKIKPRLTLDYGVRYDYETSWREKRDRWSEFGPGVANPSAGNLLGGVEYEGSGTGRCNCQFTKTWPYGYAPRLGAAFQLTSRDVIRGGWGFTFGSTNPISYLSNTAIVGTGWNQIPFTSSSFGVAAGTLGAGLQYPASELTTATLNPGIYPYAGQVNPPSYYIYPGAGRPSRVNQWNFTYERELGSKIAINAAYVGNRGVWLQSNSMLDVNANTAGIFAAHGFNVTNASDLAVLTSPVNSAAAQARGVTAPYSGWPTTLTVAQALRPYPQFTSIASDWANFGDSTYDALQIKATIRNLHGLNASAGYVFESEHSIGVTYPGGGTYTATLINDVYNRGASWMIDENSQPQVLNFAISYKSPGFGESKLLHLVTKGWNYGAFFRYASGTPIPAPYAQNNLNSVMLRADTNTTFFNRVSGVSPFLKNLNCHCINPRTNLALNPAAWSDPAPGTWGSTPITFNDYRYQRRPLEQMSLGRVFAIHESMSFELRMQFFDVFNRAELADPAGTNALQSTVTGTSGVQSGFGFVNPNSLYSQPRQGELTGIFRF